LFWCPTGLHSLIYFTGLDYCFSEFAKWLREGIRAISVWPSELDLGGAANALVRLHHLYNLHYSDMISGHFLNITSHPMTSMELSYVTRAALDLGFICDAKELMTSLEELTVSEKKPVSLDKLRTRMTLVSYLSSMTLVRYISRMTLLSYLSKMTLLSYLSRIILVSYLSRMTLQSYLSRRTLLSYLSRMTLVSYLSRMALLSCLSKMTLLLPF
jgi:hypothetical protein